MAFSPRLIAPVLLIALIAAVWFSGVGDRLSWTNLARYQSTLTAEVAAHPVLAPCLYVALYVASVTLSLPQAALLSMLGGLLFGVVAGAALAVTSATIGAVCVFQIARSAFGDPLRRRGGATLARLREELRRNGFSYLLAMRLIPVLPFWLVNLAAALGGMRVWPFAIGTFVGIMPATFVMTSIGSGLGDVLARGERPDLGVLFSLPVLAPLLGLAALSLTPIVWRRWRGRDG